MKNGYLIASPNCGRNKDGVFVCACGKCRKVKLPQAKRKDCGDGGDDRGYSGNCREDRVDPESP